MPEKLSLYCASFPSGAQEIVAEQLKKKPLEKMKIEKMLDGLAFFSTSYAPFELRQLRFLSTIFYVINQEWASDKIESLAKKIINRGFVDSGRIKALTKNKQTFRIIASRANEMIPFDRNILNRLEGMVMKTTGLRLNIKKPDVEFWLIERSEGLSFFAVRVSGLAKENKFRQSGELKKEVAELLCLESRPAPTDTVLDPFCGSGAIIRERCSYFPYQKAIAYDLDPTCVERTKTTLADKKNVEVTKIDFFKNPLTSGSIDKIITDPPWGLYRGLTEADNFFSKMVQETERLLKNSGVAVFLIGGDKTKFEKATERTKLSLKRQTNILVSGKKASIYRYQKTD